MAFPENTDKLITELQGRGYKVFEKGDLNGRIDKWANKVYKLDQDTTSGE